MLRRFSSGNPKSRSQNFEWILLLPFLYDGKDKSTFQGQQLPTWQILPVHRKIPPKIVLVDCILFNRLSTACHDQSEGKVLHLVKMKNRVFSAIILYFSVMLFRWKTMLKAIHLPKNLNFKKMVGLKVHGNLTWIQFCLYFSSESHMNFPDFSFTLKNFFSLIIS